MATGTPPTLKVMVSSRRFPNKGSVLPAAPDKKRVPWITAPEIPRATTEAAKSSHLRNAAHDAVEEAE